MPLEEAMQLLIKFLWKSWKNTSENYFQCTFTVFTSCFK